MGSIPPRLSRAAHDYSHHDCYSPRPARRYPTCVASPWRDPIKCYGPREYRSIFAGGHAFSFGYLNEAGLDIVTGVLGLILNINIDMVARTRIGVSMLTMILSRAELIKQGGSVDEQEWQEWVNKYNGFFDALEPSLPNIFPGTVNTGEDVYVWQFLAAIGIGASPEQQQRLVM